MDQKLISWVDSHIDGFLRLLEELTNVNSYSSNVSGVNRVQDILKARLERLGLRAQRVVTPPVGDFLVAHTSAYRSGQPFILLVGHADTVYPVDAKPSQFERKGTVAYGPGVLDMKGGLVVMVAALEALHAEGLLPKIPLMVICSPDEEIGSRYSRDHLQQWAAGARAAFVFEPGRAGHAIITRRKGAAVWRLRARGKAAHSGNNHRAGANAIAALAHAVLKLHALTNYEEDITVNVGLIRGGSAVNTVPDQAEASFDVRATSGAAFDRVREQVRVVVATSCVEGTSLELEQLSACPPLEETAATQSLFESFHKYAAPAGLSYGVYPGVIGGASDANFLGSMGVPTLDGLGPFGEFPHSEKEYVDLDSVRPKILNMVLWLAEQCRVSR